MSWDSSSRFNAVPHLYRASLLAPSKLGGDKVLNIHDYNQMRQDMVNVADDKTIEHIDYYGEQADRIEWQCAC